jgi:hypothetical protein
MKIKPKANYSMEGYGKLKKDKIYNAVIAYNQPDFKSKGKIFVEANEDLRIELLLTANEYKIITK